jgi:hypothetical protein
MDARQAGDNRERIRQIEAKALRKLKHPSRSRKLRSFLDTQAVSFRLSIVSLQFWATLPQCHARA